MDSPLGIYFIVAPKTGGGGGALSPRRPAATGTTRGTSVIKQAITETHRTFACVHFVIESDTEISQENTLRSVCGHVVLIKIYVVKSKGKKSLKAQQTRTLVSVFGCLLADNALSQV